MGVGNILMAKRRAGVGGSFDMSIFDFDRQLDFDEFVRRTLRPWESIPQIRFITEGRILPTFSEESVAASATHVAFGAVTGLSTRAFVANYLANRYLIPFQTVGTTLVTPAVLSYAAFSDQMSELERTPGREHEVQPFWAAFGQAMTGTGFGAGGWSYE